ncbi:MAG: YigZ family protein, partial [Solobacterium sp.]|nr:YigZ family protein [Solobacterium sp.]
MRVKEPFRKETVINKSRFITCLSPAKSEEEARAFFTAVRKEFPDSTHVCTAFVIG